MPVQLEAPALLSVPACAQLLSVSPNTVLNWAKSDPEFPKPIRAGGKRLRFRRADVVAYLRARGVEPPAADATALANFVRDLAGSTDDALVKAWLTRLLRGESASSSGKP